MVAAVAAALLLLLLFLLRLPLVVHVVWLLASFEGRGVVLFGRVVAVAVVWVVPALSMCTVLA